MFCPVLSSEETPALFLPDIRGDSPVVSVILYEVRRNLRNPEIAINFI